MNLRRTLHKNKGYTLLELMLTLFVFAIITMFGVPAFYQFIETSRAKTEIIKAANFLRSAQEIATASNRTVYVFTEGYFDSANTEDYWYQDWIMAFKPIGENNRTITAQDAELRITGENAPNPNYLISKQKIFTESSAFHLNVLDSVNHNAVDLKKISGSDYAADEFESDGYSVVRAEDIQGTKTGKPTYMIFYPSGAVVMPVFVLDENKLAADKTHFKKAHQWDKIKTDFKEPVAILAGCRMGHALTIDSINYTFNQQAISHANLFNSVERKRTVDTGNQILHSAPSFGNEFCGSKYVQ